MKIDFLRNRVFFKKPFRELFLLCLVSTSIYIHTNAGTDKFSFLSKIDNWTIERKVEQPSQNILCRASITSHGTWFGMRMRLNEYDELVVPDELRELDLPTKSTLKRVKNVLKKCRSSLIFFSDGFLMD